MSKFLVVPIVGLLLMIGTVFNESYETVGVAGNPPGSIGFNLCYGASIKQDGECLVNIENARGWPYEFLERTDNVENRYEELVRNNETYPVASTDAISIRVLPFIVSYFFWQFVSVVGYLIFKKVRSTLVLVVLGAMAGLVYLGILNV